MSASSTAPSGSTLRDRARDAVRDEVLRQAWILFGEQGFAATTVEQVAEATGMSRRTFFRYFSGKEELVSARFQAAGGEVAVALAARPESEPIWQALRAGFDPLIASVEDYQEIARALVLMLREEPEVRAATTERAHRWLELLEPIVIARLGGAQSRAHDRLRARALIGSAMACFDSAQLTWAESGGRKLSSLVDEAMTTVAPIA